MDIEWFAIVDLIVETVVVLQWIYEKDGENAVIGPQGQHSANASIRIL